MEIVITVVFILVIGPFLFILFGWAHPAKAMKPDPAFGGRPARLLSGSDFAGNKVRPGRGSQNWDGSVSKGARGVLSQEFQGLPGASEKNSHVTPIQREYVRFFRIKLPKGANEYRAAQFIAKHASGLAENEDPMLEDWKAIENIMRALSQDREILKENYGIKKPGIALIRCALEALRQEGQPYQQSGKDIGSVVAKLLELKPDRKLPDRQARPECFLPGSDLSDRMKT